MSKPIAPSRRRIFAKFALSIQSTWFYSHVDIMSSAGKPTFLMFAFLFFFSASLKQTALFALRKYHVCHVSVIVIPKSCLSKLSLVQTWFCVDIFCYFLCKITCIMRFEPGLWHKLAHTTNTFNVCISLK